MSSHYDHYQLPNGGVTRTDGQGNYDYKDPQSGEWKPLRDPKIQRMIPKDGFKIPENPPRLPRTAVTPPSAQGAVRAAAGLAARLLRIIPK